MVLRYIVLPEVIDRHVQSTVFSQRTDHIRPMLVYRKFATQVLGLLH